MTNQIETQEKIIAITGAMRDLLLYKNQKYGDSALTPKQIFYKGDAVNSIVQAFWECWKSDGSN